MSQMFNDEVTDEMLGALSREDLERFTRGLLAQLELTANALDDIDERLKTASTDLDRVQRAWE